jgi:hypothetical protein
MRHEEHGSQRTRDRLQDALLDDGRIFGWHASAGSAACHGIQQGFPGRAQMEVQTHAPWQARRRKVAAVD